MDISKAFRSYISSCLVWILLVVLGRGEDVQSSPKLFYMNELCRRHFGIAISDRRAVRMAPWNPPSHVPPRITCIVPVWSNRYQNYMLSTTFKTMDLSKPSPSESCQTARLDLYNGNTTSSYYRLSGPNGICGKHATKNYYSTTRNIMTMKFATEFNSKDKYEYFEAVITPYHTGRCADDEFRCKNGRCVYHSLLCDSYNNCGDDSDEKDCKKLLLSIAAIIGIVVGCVTVVICKCCCAVCGYERI